MKPQKASFQENNFHNIAPEILIAAGGTGGHLYPAIALCHALKGSPYRVTLLTDQRPVLDGLDLPENVKFEQIYLPQLKGARTYPKFIIGALYHTLKLCWRFIKQKPAAVVGFGGYPVIPPLVAAILRRVPILIHEQNALLGRVNRLFAPFAAHLALTFKETLRLPKKVPATITGIPVRPHFHELFNHFYAPSQDKREINILITGGSQGAQVMSQIVAPSLTDLPINLRQRLRVTQQCRPEDLEKVRALYNQHNIRAELQSFFTNVPELLGKAHLTITRAGASTLAELTLGGKPAILIPYPHAMENHQAINASMFEKSGAAMVFMEKEALRDSLASYLKNVLLDERKLALLASQIQLLGVPDAAIRLARVVDLVALNK